MGTDVSEDHVKKLSLWGDFRSKFSYNKVKRDYNLYYNPKVLWDLQKTAANKRKGISVPMRAGTFIEQPREQTSLPQRNTTFIENTHD